MPTLLISFAILFVFHQIIIFYSYHLNDSRKECERDTYLNGTPDRLACMLTSVLSFELNSHQGLNKYIFVQDQLVKLQ